MRTINLTQGPANASEVILGCMRMPALSAPAIAIAWILRHPAHIMPIVGSMNKQHIAQDCEGSGIVLTHALSH